MTQCPYDKLTVRRINDKLKKTRPRLEQLSDASVKSILKTYLDYRWKRCSKRNRKIIEPQYIAEKLLWCRFLILAFHSSLRIIAIDEFAIDDTHA